MGVKAECRMQNAECGLKKPRMDTDYTDCHG
jgi:hypothetical protein